MTEFLTSSVTPIDPSQLFSDGFELSDQSIIPSSDFTGSFVQGENNVEFYIYDANVNNVYSSYLFEGWTISNQNTDTKELNATDTIVLNPEKDIFDAGYQNGTLYGIYNFVNYELNSTPDNRYYISQISSDRTEIALKSNFISSSATIIAYGELKEKIDSADYFDEFYLSFGNNEYIIGVNLDVIDDEEEASILIKLYEPLPVEYQLKDTLYVATKVGETQAYKVDFTEDFSSLLQEATYIKGPNINIELGDLVNNSTTLKSKSDLVNTNSSQSLNKLTEVLNQKGVTITPNYSYNTFNEFVNFSSAKERINNFVEKVAQIQAYEADIETISATTSSNPNVVEISSSIASLETNIQNLVKNFDGFESYQYYTSGAFAYPKTGSAYPYTLKSTTDSEVLTWLGSDVENNQYYGGYILSASLYDESNQNWLYYTVPEFIREDSNNDNYLSFTNMVGQHFDEIWLYTKALSERFNTTNDPDSGLPLQLAEEAVTNLGFPAFGNNYNNQDNFIGLTGEDNGVYVPPTGSELITQYIAVNNGEIINYWNLQYSYLNYVEQLENPGWPYAIDKVSKEIFKRLYHNMAYLTKKKGTITGLRQLINIWGIPNTILRINEFGGKNKDNSDDYDYWYNRYSWAYHPVSTQQIASSSVKMPWMPLERNYIADSEYIVPDGFAFRFKTIGYPSSSYVGDFFTQSLASKKSNGTNDAQMDFGLELKYTPFATGSYSGSTTSDSASYGEIRFYLSGSSTVKKSTIISLPYFDKGWWSVLVQRDQHVSASTHNTNTTYSLYVKNKQYNGFDGNYIGWEGSASIYVDGTTEAEYNEAWNNFGTTTHDGLYLGGYISGSSLGTKEIQPFGKIFSGSLQEFRYYSNDIAETVFNDFVMNPESVEGNNITGSESSFDIVNFRAPLGNEMEFLFTSSVSASYTASINSLHPAVSGTAPSVITGSFINPADSSITSSYSFINYENITTRNFSKPNTEVYFLDQPAIGIRNRISNKIQVQDGDQYGTILSREVSIDQDYQISRSYTENITNLEVAFSPQDEVNDDIIATFGYGVVSEVLADPRFYSSSDSYYPGLRSIAEDYFKKYTKGNIYDYLRLIKYFDNSIFKAIKAYVPARTGVTTGVVIKQHLLERNRRPPVLLDPTTTVAVNSSASWNAPIELGNLELTSSIPIGTFDGGAGGVVNDFNIPLQISGSDFYVTSNASLVAGAGEINVFDESSFTVTATAEGLFTWAGQLVQQTTPEGYDTFYDENVPLIFGLTYRQTNADAEFTLRLKDGSDNIIQELDFVDPGNTNQYRTVFFNPIFPTEDKGYKITVDFTNGTATLLQFTSSVLNTYPTGGYGSNTIYNSSTTPPYLLPLPSGYDYELNKYNLRQGYLNTLKTTLGDLTKAEVSEKAFYDGEYSGSEFIATTQSLFDNPYVDQSLIDTSYDVRVQVDSAYSSIPPIGYYTASIYFREDAGDYARVTPDTFLTEPNWSPNELYRIWLCKNTSYIDDVAVAAIAFNTDKIPLLGDNGTPTLGFYPSGSVAGTISTPTGFWQYYRADSAVPNFYLHISESWLSNGNWITDNNAYGQRGADIWSGGLRLFDYDTAGLVEGINWDYRPSQNMLWMIFTPQNIGGGGQRPLKGQGDPQFNSTPGSWQLNTFYLNPAIGADITRVKYKNHEERLTQWRNGITTTNTPPGSGSAYFAFSSLINTSSVDASQTTLRLLSFNTIDLNGNDNQNTIGNQPSFAVELNASGSAPTWPNSQLINTATWDQQGFGTVTGNDNNVLFYTFNLPDFQERNSFFLTSHLSKSLDTFFNFDPILPADFNIDNSDYNALFNNVTESRFSDKIEEVDYTNGIEVPANLENIKSGNAIKANVPDSNYSSQFWTLPRYKGSTLQSANYNYFTPTTSSLTFINGDTGSWGGDDSYGNTAVINKNPIYFAHFKTSYHNLQNAGTYTFDIDELIEAPREDITGTNITPKTVKVEGSGDMLTTVKSTFEVDRKAIVAYNTTKFNNVDYGLLSAGSQYIFQGALEMPTIAATTTGKLGEKTDPYRFPSSIVTMSFTTASWLQMYRGAGGSTPTTKVTSSAWGSTGKGWMATGSNCLYLQGSRTYISASVNWRTGSATEYYGPGLGLLHSFNSAVSKSTSAYISIGGGGIVNYYLGVPIESPSSNVTKTLPDVDSNYSYENYSASLLPSTFRNWDSPEKFLIQRGDEIVVTYNLTQFAIGVEGDRATWQEQTFHVLNVTQETDVTGVESTYSASGCDAIQCYSPGPITLGLANKIEVYPNPQDFEIPGGQIWGFQVRRRINADDRVIVFQTPPEVGRNSATGSGEGYLIPNDFTAQQKRNALTLINQLKAKNAYRNDERNTTQ